MINWTFFRADAKAENIIQQVYKSSSFSCFTPLALRPWGARPRRPCSTSPGCWERPPTLSTSRHWSAGPCWYVDAHLLDLVLLILPVLPSGHLRAGESLFCVCPVTVTGFFASRVIRQPVAPSVYCPVPSLPAGPSRRTCILSLEDLNIKHQLNINIIKRSLILTMIVSWHYITYLGLHDEAAMVHVEDYKYPGRIQLGLDH